MKQLTEKAKQLFKQWGQNGGKLRARRLLPHERSAIAATAARARWNKEHSSISPLMQSVRLEDAKINDPVYLEEILLYGTWQDWQKIYKIISDHPFGDTANAMVKVCAHAKIYGTTSLWKGIMRSLQGVSY